MKQTTTKETIINAGIRTDDRFYLIGVTDRQRREYTVLDISKAYYQKDGIEQVTTNIKAKNDATGKMIVFDLINLIGIEAKYIGE